MQRKEELISKLFHSECFREELEILLELIRKDDSGATPKVIQELFRQLEKVPDYEEAIFTRIKHKIDAGIKEVEYKPIQTQTSSLRNPIHARQFWMYRIAASVLILATLGWLVYQFGMDHQIHEQTAFSEIKSIELPDGSTVSLNGNSSLKYDQNWADGETRMVYLEGEAFFEVVMNQ